MSKQILKVTIPAVAPSVNTYMNCKIERVGRRLRVKKYPSDESKEFTHIASKSVKDAIKEQGWKMPLENKKVIVEIDVYFRKRGRDADNILKLTLDVLQAQGVVFNDSCIIPRIMHTYIDKDNPRTEMTIYEDDTIGVFNDEEQMSEFISHNCDKCTKKKEHCAVFRGLMESRVHDYDMEHNTCGKKKEYKNKK